MSTSSVRHAWLERQAEDLAYASANKMPQEALQAAVARYRALSSEERTVVDQLLSDQLTSEDEDDRFLAEALIDEFEIVSAVPALRSLATWLESQHWPGAPYEWAKVNRILGNLVSDSP